MRIALVDDEEDVLIDAKAYIARYFHGNGEDYSVSCFRDGLDILSGYSPAKYDIIFLDIDMPYIDGMKTARKIREMDEQVILVFMTNLARYAVRGYEVGALSFLVKPFSYGNFAVTLKRAEGILKKYGGNRVLLSSEEGIKVIDSQDIYYVEVYDHWLIYHLDETSIKVRGSMKKLQEQLNCLCFHLCNRCYLVNLRHVTAIKGDMLQVGPYSLKISRSKKKSFTAALTDYFGGGI